MLKVPHLIGATAGVGFALFLKKTAPRKVSPKANKRSSKANSAKNRPAQRHNGDMTHAAGS